jgi:hypothetical protein
VGCRLAAEVPVALRSDIGGNRRLVYLLRKDTEEQRDPTSPWCRASGSPLLRVTSVTGARASGRPTGSPSFRKWLARSRPTPTPFDRGPFGGRGQRFGIIGDPWSIGSFGCRTSAPEGSAARILDRSPRRVAHGSTVDIETSKPWRIRPAFRRSLGIVLGCGHRGQVSRTLDDLESNIPSGIDDSAPRVLRDAPARVPRAQQGGTGRASTPSRVSGARLETSARVGRNGSNTPSGAEDPLQPIQGVRGFEHGPPTRV